MISARRARSKAVRILRYKCALPPDLVIERFCRFAATEKHNPFHPFSSFYDPRIGLHTYVDGNGVSGYYESGIRKRDDTLQNLKVWFELSVTPRGEGSTVTCVIFSSPYFLLLALIMLADAIAISFTDVMGGGFMLGLALVCFILEGFDQKRVKEQICTLAPKQKPKNKHSRLQN